MSEAIKTTTLRKLRYTPLSDLMRGNLSSRLDVKGRIEAAELPQQAKDLILRVVRRTRLWKAEKADVAGELIAHFADGIESGQSGEQLLQSFGDENHAVRLIRRAKKRNRPIAWHCLRALVRLIIAMIVLYAGMAVYFLSGRPTVSVNYIAALNASAQRAPAHERAWPLYRRAILAMGVRTREQKFQLDDLLYPPVEKDTRPQLAAWLHAHEAEIEQVRQASEIPVLGFILGPGGSADDAELWPDLTRQPEGIDLASTLLPHILEMKALGEIVSADAKLALLEKDKPRLLRDIHALLNIADQVREHQLLIVVYVSLGSRAAALDRIDEVMADAPQLLDDSDLQALAHRLAKPDRAADMIDVQGERLIFQDCLQRIYTDDGHGDGRLTPQGLAYLMNIRTFLDNRHAVDAKIGIFGPSTVVLSAGRREVMEKYQSLMGRFQADLNTPVYELDWKALYNQVGKLQEGSNRLRYLPLVMLVPSPNQLRRHVEIYLGHRDGVAAGMALEFYRRRNGRYPATLEELVPSLLPAMPVDRIGGGSVRYHLIDGKPVVYSVGVDRDDDGGRPPIDSDKPSISRAADWTQSPHVWNGDWILFPQSRNNAADY